MAEAAATATSGKVVIRNIGLLLSGDIDRPILEADTIVCDKGRIVAVGKEADCNTEQPDLLIDARQTCVAPGLIDSHVHPVFGEGVIINLEGAGEKAEAEVRFVDRGTKRLALAWAPLTKR